LRAAFGPAVHFSRDFTHYSDLQDILGSLFGDAGGIFGTCSGAAERRRGTAPAGARTCVSIWKSILRSGFGPSGRSRCRDRGMRRVQGIGAEAGPRRPCRTAGPRRGVCRPRLHPGAADLSFLRGGAERSYRPCRDARRRPRQNAQAADAQIPPGVETGSPAEAGRTGEAGVRGGPAATSTSFCSTPHNVFQRKEGDLYCEVPVPSRWPRLARDRGAHGRGLRHAQDRGGHRIRTPLSPPGQGCRARTATARATST